MVPAHELAAELGISVRTLYRDVATLVAQGAPIEGAAGLGYVLRPGYTLPPLMFSDEELDALILGLRLVRARTDPALGTAADDALAKIVAVLPAERDPAVESSGLLAGPSHGQAAPILTTIRAATRAECKLRLRYTDKRGAQSDRTVWPVAVGFFDTAAVLVAWCELRAAFRHFRLDLIAEADVLPERYGTHRRVLLANWRSRRQPPTDRN